MNERKIGKRVQALLSGVIGIITLAFALQQSVEAKAPDKVDDPAKGGIAANFDKIPIEAREIADGVYQATGVGNTYLISTSEGHVLFDTGLAYQAKDQIDALLAVVPDLPVTHIIISHSHADHAGGVKRWIKDDTKGDIEIVTHKEFLEEQRYLEELEPYQWNRNRTLYPFMPKDIPTHDKLAIFGGIKPTVEVEIERPYRFKQGGVEFEVYAVPNGADAADSLLLWLPQKKILFSGDFFGALFPQFPNIFTMRGEKIRRAIEYRDSLDVVLALSPEMVAPGHRNPVTGNINIIRDVLKMRDAVTYVHDATIAGMNAGKTVEQLMDEIKLPPELKLTQEHGRVSWAVRSIWEYYATWFHFDKTTELYHVPENDVYGDIVALAGAKEMINKATGYVEKNQPLHSLHLVDIVLENDALNEDALRVRKSALEILLNEAKTGFQNSYEIYWLNSRLRDTNEKLQRLKPADQ